jgi:two-component sensor histidine kinase
MRNLQPRSWHSMTLIAVAGIGIGLSATVAYHYSAMQIEDARHHMMIEAATLAEDLKLYLNSREMIAKAVGAVFEPPDLSQPHPLASVGKKVLDLTPEIAVMAWVPQVDPSRIRDVLGSLSASGQQPRLFGPDFAPVDVTDPGRVLYPVVDVESKSGNHKIGLGMEVGLFPSRKVAFERARDEQRVIATAPVALLQPFNTMGYILYSPVYNEGVFLGCLLFAFRIDELLAAFAHTRRIPMNFGVYDATDPGPSTFLVRVTQRGAIETVNSSFPSEGEEVLRQSLDFAGRKLLLRSEPGPVLTRAGMQPALMVVSLGLILTGMLLWIMRYFMQYSRRLAAEIAATNAMKISLELSNRELGHRVGNLLAVAQGIIGLSYQPSLGTLEFRDSIIARLHALHQSVGLINRADWGGVWLHELLQTEFAPVADRINVSGHDALLKPQAAQSLSLLFYELMTNSSKHGALSAREGTVTTEWEIKNSESGRRFCFRWQENNHGIIKPPTRQGFGTKLLTRLVPGDLSGHATVNFEPGCFRYELEAPVERVVEQEATAAVTVKAVVPLHVTRGYLAEEKLMA